MELIDQKEVLMILVYFLQLVKIFMLVFHIVDDLQLV